jgi:membrane-associated phospholipid phosphatase
MPWLQRKSHPLVQISTLVVPETRWTLGGTLVALWTYPASLLPSALVVGYAAWRLRDARPAVLWVAANLVELAGKLLVARPALYAHGRHVTGFDHSLPSGHTMRSLVVAYSLAALWRRGRLAYVWALSVPFALVVTGDHVPTDVVAGLLAFAALALV